MRLIYFLCLILHSISYAQNLNDLLNDKNVTWVAEGYQDIVSERLLLEADKMNNVLLLKFINREELITEPFLKSLIENAILRDKIPIYKDEKCIEPMDKWDFKVRNEKHYAYSPEDTPGLCVIRSKPDVFFHRLYQTYYYDKERAKFGVLNNAIALIGCLSDEKSNNIIYEPICWIKVKNIEMPYNLENKDIAWAALLSETDNKICFEGQHKTIRELKMVEKEPTKHCLEFIKKSTSVPIFGSNDKELKFPLDSLERNETLKNIEEENIKYYGLNLNQTWYWNDNKNQLEIYLNSIGIIAGIYDENDKFKFNRTIFYQRND